MIIKTFQPVRHGFRRLDQHDIIDLQRLGQGSDVRVIGISKDTVTKQGKFRAKYDLAFPLGADDEGDVCEQFGVWVEKSMYGKKYMGIQRATFLIGSDGSIIKSWPKVKVPGHADAVLEAVKAL